MELIGRQVYQKLSIGKSYRNTLTFLPHDFNVSNKKYPLLMVHPGSGEVSTQGGVQALLKNGINKMLAEGWDPYVTKPTEQKFIVFTVQQDSTGYALTPNAMFAALQNNKMIEGRWWEDSVFVTGLSLGACATCFFFENAYADEYLPKVAGLIPMSGVKLSNQNYNFDYIKKYPKPVWAFCGDKDTAPRLNFFKLLKENVPDIIATEYAGKHDGWINQYKNARYQGLSVLEWCASLIPERLPIVNVERHVVEGEMLYYGSKIDSNCILRIVDSGVSVATVKYIVK